MTASRTSTALTFLLAAVFLGLTCLPGVHWHDTGEFPAVTWWWTLSHPPGHAVHAMAARPPQWLPLGDLGFRGNLSSGLLLAAALAVFERILAAVAPRLPGYARVAAAVSPAFWPGVWLQGARAEVYACQLVLLAGIGLAVAHLSRTRDARHFLAAAALLGLSGACHSLLGVAFMPLVCGTALRLRLPFKAWALGAVAGCVGLLAALYVPLRAHGGLDVGWGNPNDFERFVDTLLARDWQKNLVSSGSTGLDLMGNAADIGEAVMSQVGTVGALLLGLGVCVWLRRAAHQTPWPLLAGAAVAVPVLATRFFYPYDGTNPDLGGYFAPAEGALLVVAAWVFSHAPPRAAVVLAVAPFLALGPDPGGPLGARMGSRTAEHAIRSVFDEVPPGGVLLASDYTTWFQADWLRVVTEERPDVTTLFRGRIRAPWAAERARRVGAFGALGPGAERLDRFPEVFDTAEVRIEAGVNVDELGPLLAGLSPVGLLMRSDGAPCDPPRTAAAWTNLERGPLDPDARIALAFRHVMAAENLFGVAERPGIAAIARQHLSAAAALVPGGTDELIAVLQRRWGVPESPPPQGL